MGVRKEPKSVLFEFPLLTHSLMNYTIVKAAHKLVGKLTPGVNFINEIRTNFSYKSRFFYVKVTR